MRYEAEKITDQSYTRRINLQSNINEERKQKFRYQDLKRDLKRSLNFWVKTKTFKVQIFQRLKVTIDREKCLLNANFRSCLKSR